ncbi:SMP-30/gluconolactonase/LRE family protein [Micropruina sp.]|uniref:SMP-30/gluconolactonase/LRE family protein n=1 Tax=Micropruina sp. TaxID=2737536 RepID=UPI0039E6AD0B
MSNNSASGLPTAAAAGVVPAGAELRRVVTGATWSEGPVWLPDRSVVRWSDIPGNRILEVNPADGVLQVHRTDVEFTNGRTLDLAGNVIQASHGRRAIERETADGEVSIVVDQWDGRRLNSPNDVIVASDGAIWFSDPPYGIVQAHEGHLGDPEYGGCHVFRYDERAGKLTAAITDVEEPNGLAFSPDESILYVTDTSCVLRKDGSGNHHIVAYDVAADGSCSNRRVFAVIDKGVADGIRVDAEGRVWSSSEDAVLVYAPDGELLTAIPVPERVGNMCFGGAAGSTLFIAAHTSIYAIETTTTGAGRPAR